MLFGRTSVPQPTVYADSCLRFWNVELSHMKAVAHWRVLKSFLPRLRHLCFSGCAGGKTKEIHTTQGVIWWTMRGGTGRLDCWSQSWRQSSIWTAVDEAWRNNSTAVLVCVCLWALVPTHLGPGSPLSQLSWEVQAWHIPQTCKRLSPPLSTKLRFSSEGTCRVSHTQPHTRAQT